MKLLAVRIQNYRSIVDSGIVDVDDRVTVIIGKNEQGKTNFLKALHSFNSSVSYTSDDLPNHLRTDLEKKHGSLIPLVSIWLALDDSDRKVLEKVIASIEKVDRFKITRFYDGHYSYWSIATDNAESDVTFAKPEISGPVESLKSEAESLRSKIEAHATRLPAFAPAKAQADNHINQFMDSNFADKTSIDNLIKTFLTALKGLPGQDPAIQADIANVSKSIESIKVDLVNILANDPTIKFEQTLPHFLFHSTSLDKIPNEVNIFDFVKDPEATSKGMASLCKVAGLSTQIIQDLSSGAETQRCEAYEDHYKTSISGGINEFWTQERYSVHFRISKERLSVSISDSTYDRRIPPSERSDGFQWYLSFYSVLLSEVSSNDPTILLLDNPGLELHSDGQRDIKRFLEEKLSPTTQVIYVTHSPAMIDTYNLEQVRCVELRGDMQGTRVSKLTFEGDEVDLLEPVRSAIGASLVDTLMTNDYNVLVEGAADKPILEAAFASYGAKEGKKVMINGSISESGLLLPNFYKKTGLPYAIFLDADSGGRDLGKKLQSAGISADKIVNLSDVSKKDKDHELEDLFSYQVYYAAVRDTYPNLTIQEVVSTEGKRTRLYAEAFKQNHRIGFNKRRVGETLKRHLGENKADEETAMNLKIVVESIWKTLQAQVKA